MRIISTYLLVVTATRFNKSSISSPMSSSALIRIRWRVNKVSESMDTSGTKYDKVFPLPVDPEMTTLKFEG